MAILLICFIAGVICAIIASGKRRNPVGWFVIGFLLPLIGVILVLVLPPGSSGLDTEPMFVAPQTPAPDPRQASIDALERLAALRDRGVLTAEEFEAKKKELLEMQPAAATDMVTCPSCQRRVAKAMTVMTGDGVLCDRCHAST